MSVSAIGKTSLKRNKQAKSNDMKVYVLYSYPAIGDDMEHRQVVDVYFNSDHARQDCSYYNSVAIEEDEEYRYDYYEVEILNNPRTRVN